MRVPDDIAVIGFDDIEDGRFATPTLSTVSPDKAGIAAIAIELLPKRIGLTDAPPLGVVAKHHLELRESTVG